MNIRVLVVDNNRDLYDLFDRHLIESNPDFKIELADSTQDALRLLDERDYDAIVCDYSPGPSEMNGLDLLHWLRNSGRNLHFVMFTEQSMEEIAIKALNLGANFYLRKDDDDFRSLIIDLADDIRTSVEQNRIQHQLQESEAKFRNLFESSLDGIVAVGNDGRIVEYNQAFASMMDYRLDELVGMSFRDLTPASWHKLDDYAEEQLRENGFYNIFEKELITKSGRLIPVSVSSWKMSNEYGRSLGAWAIVRNISSQKFTEEELRTSEERFRRLFHDSPIGICLFNSKGYLIDANRSLLDTFGVSNITDLADYNIFKDPNFPSDVMMRVQKGEVVDYILEFDFDKAEKLEIYEKLQTDAKRLRIIAGPYGMKEKQKITGFFLQMQDMTE